jgi:hypothetical protein
MRFLAGQALGETLLTTAAPRIGPPRCPLQTRWLSRWPAGVACNAYKGGDMEG